LRKGVKSPQAGLGYLKMEKDRKIRLVKEVGEKRHSMR